MDYHVKRKFKEEIIKAFMIIAIHIIVQLFRVSFRFVSFHKSRSAPRPVQFMTLAGLCWSRNWDCFSCLYTEVFVLRNCFRTHWPHRCLAWARGWKVCWDDCGHVPLSSPSLFSRQGQHGGHHRAHQLECHWYLQVDKGEQPCYPFVKLTDL